MPNYFALNSSEVTARRAAAVARGHVPYEYTGDIELAIRVAQATARPLLLLGEPGCGKSTLARDVALGLGYAYIEEVVTSRTAARDLLWRFDHVRRLGDAPIAANSARVAKLRHYLEPGPIWWALNPASALRRGAGDDDGDVSDAATPARENRDSKTGTVLLLDEIDKADPDVPNDLLVALGEYRFEVADPLTHVAQQPGRELLVFLTTNGERELPPAFLRRCIPLELKRPEPQTLKTIIQSHCARAAANAESSADLDALIDAVLGLLASPPESAAPRRAPGTAEAIDAVRACIAENVRGPTRTVTSRTDERDERDPRWSTIAELTLWKKTEPAKVEDKPA